MAALQGDYFVLERAGDSSVPLLKWRQESGEFRKGRAVVGQEAVQLQLLDPAPAEPKMVDHHALPDPVVSTRIRNVLRKFELHDVQLIQAVVWIGNDVYVYWLVHIFNEVRCLDEEKSEVIRSPSRRFIHSIERLVLMEEVLAAIPLKERRVFALAESPSVNLFHREVVEEILALTPAVEGLRFVPAAEWTTDSAFE
ncbi:imm11 family protein [Myxococcus sp. MxC21-1]|uniref:imm11 family protein n=1 Tax=Myxococcus sp. MxC21-1 TaxID=3041439 RepID=UPI003977B26F